MVEMEINIPATKRGLATALARIEEFRAARNLYDEQIARARVVAEELITNTIKYGHHGECDRPIRLRLRAGQALTMIYEDQAPQFDPLLWRPPGDPVAERREGHAGINLILGLSSTVAHEGGPQWNRLTLTFAAGIRR
jgi:anti-sigma regulatory factor (Ser/Thr protein kinase)